MIKPDDVKLTEIEVRGIIAGCTDFPVDDDREIDWHNPTIYQGVITDEDRAIALQAQRKLWGILKDYGHQVGIKQDEPSESAYIFTIPLEEYREITKILEEG